MSRIIEIREGEIVLARRIPAAAAWNDGLAFFSQDTDFIQVGQWGYNSGKELRAHAHNDVPREVPLTQEVIFVYSGRLRANIYDSHAHKVAELDGLPGDVLVMLRGGHGYDILEDNTRVLEIKNGPYVGADADRRAI